MTTLTLHITNQDILPALIDTLKRFNGVSIVDPTDCTFTDPTLLDKKISKGISEYKQGKGSTNAWSSPRRQTGSTRA